MTEGLPLRLTRGPTGAGLISYARNMSSLTRDEAVTRAGLLRVLAYEIDLDLSAAGESGEFGSTTTVRFACERPGEETFIELRPVRLHEVTLNGSPIDPAGLADNRLRLSDLAATNELTVRATMAYSITGEGLHRFTDPEDGAVYLYAQTFLDEAQRVFACFDQPDLKAPVSMTVSVPVGWEVASNGAGTEVSPGRWEFATTQPLATYFVTVMAGPYHVLRDEHDGIPLELYCRRSLAAHLDKDEEEVFGLTKQCLDRFHQLFGVRYPFGKYGQAFVPEFNAGAMENPGLVTIRDEFVYRSAVTDAERELRSVVIAHEMAHMWFGDLVTMRWWDDLWLNESFAEYMGYRITAEATRFTNAWTSFAVGRKGWGYAADQSPSTHPVAPEDVPDAALALLNFDGISYAKGASALRQLVAWVGDEPFLAGLREHFTAHAFGNATLADLLDAVSRASGGDLHGWADVWLRRPQVNTLRPAVTVADGRYSTVEIVQTAPEAYPTLRPHRIGVGVYRGDPDPGALVRLQQRVEVALDPSVDNGRTPLPELAGSPAGDLLLLNDGDLTFAKVRFDEASRAALPRVLPRLADPLARALVWAATADATRDAELPAREFVALCTAGLPMETEVAVFEDVAQFARVQAIGRYLAPDAQPAARAALATACRIAMEAATPGEGEQLAAARWFARFAGPREAEVLRAWLDGDRVPEGLKLDAELRWNVLHRLVVLGAADEADIDAEYDRDHTALGAVYAAGARAARPDPEAKARAWQLILDDTELSNRHLVATAEGFWQPEQLELTRAYADRYFADMPEMARRRSAQMIYQISALAYPGFVVEPETLAAAERLIATDDVNQVLRRIVVDQTDGLRRALAARTLS
jgi:aminopeptidase N